MATKTYMNPATGTVQPVEDWRGDYISTDPGAWFLPDWPDRSEANWIRGAGLVEVVKDAEGTWIEI